MHWKTKRDDDSAMEVWPQEETSSRQGGSYLRLSVRTSQMVPRELPWLSCLSRDSTVCPASEEKGLPEEQWVLHSCRLCLQYRIILTGSIRIVTDNNDPKPPGRPSASNVRSRDMGDVIRRSICLSLDSSGYIRQMQSGFKLNEYGMIYMDYWDHVKINYSGLLRPR